MVGGTLRQKRTFLKYTARAGMAVSDECAGTSLLEEGPGRAAFGASDPLLGVGAGRVPISLYLP